MSNQPEDETLNDRQLLLAMLRELRRIADMLEEATINVHVTNRVEVEGDVTSHEPR